MKKAKDRPRRDAREDMLPANLATRQPSVFVIFGEAVILER
jgi:hypothetical protein